MKIILSILAVTISINAYEGCSNTKRDALMELSGNIKSTVKTSFDQNITVENNDESVETKISSYINASTNLSLVNIQYKRKSSDLVCASVNKKDQVENTQKLLDKALLFEEKNLPNNINEKINKLDNWIKDIEELTFLMGAFLEDTTKQQEVLNKKEKRFKDLYYESLAKSNSLVWRSCEETQEDAIKSLNKKLFKNQSKKDKKGFFSSLFSSDEDLLIELFDKQINYTKTKKETCAFIKKDELLTIALKMNADVQRFNTSVLDKDPKQRFEQISNYLEHLNVTKAMIALYPKTFDKSNFSKITSVKNQLQNIQKTTYPQFIQFHIKAENSLVIKLDGKVINNNVKYYVIHGDHSYSITAKDRCPIKGSVNLDFKEDEIVSDDFEDKKYPTVLFITDKSPNIFVDGQMVKANIITPIKKCDGEVRYIVKFAGQSRDGEISLSANNSETIELNFLTSQELDIFNDAKTKKFTTTSGAKFSESLTSLASESFIFLLEESTEHGKVILHEKGSFKYISDENFVGLDNFEYVIKSNGKTSAPKVVNITVINSTAPKAIQEKKVELEDTNTTENEVTPVIEEEKKVKTQSGEADEERYQKFKTYVDSMPFDKEKIQKLQEKYPSLFNRLLKEKTGN
ncbi:MAG: hypothetical protein U9O86_08930 [Campylobacterota bacterium]|nr:hypothetical protein [Campylobacterota bacterium]